MSPSLPASTNQPIYFCLGMLINMQSNSSAVVEDALDALAPKHPLVRFVKLHHEIAEMDHVQPPALLAYRDAEVFATLVDLLASMPNGRSCSADSLGDLLKAYVLSPPSMCMSDC